ncbi:LexA family protein [Shewanella frigidimarina]|uniref:LexA family protein n=1 Tax=Shewanella frigidimarina TaxID=56812 RepID=UPI003D7B68C9
MNIIISSISAGITGFESPANGYIQKALSFDDLLVEHPSATFIGVAQGESMIGSGIFDGDILIIDRQVTAQTGDIVVANFNGEFVCKILDLKNKVLISSNDKNQPVPIHKCDVFSIEGVVTRSIRCHRKSPLLQL